MIICIVGPTGSGKSNLSIKLAKRYNAIIINCDASQVYREMNIATAKIVEEEKKGIPHFLLDIKNFNEDYTVYDYQTDCRNVINEHKDQNIIIVGGTGLYLKAALYDYQFGKEVRSDINYDELTNEELYRNVKEMNPNTEIHQNNRQRLISYLSHEHIESDLSKPIYDNVHFIGLTMERDLLYNRINERVDEMFSDGLLEEAKYFYNKKISAKSLETVIGYKELFKYFNQEISLEDAKDLIKLHSRRYAKRQYTWFKNQLPTKWFNPNEIDLIINEIEKS